MAFGVGNGAGLVTQSGVDVRVDPYNRRVRFVGPERPTVVDTWLASSSDVLREVGKIIVYATNDGREWERRGFVNEGRITRFFVSGDANVWSLFIDDTRAANPRKDEEDRIVDLANDKASGGASTELPPEFSSRIAEPRDGDAVSELLQSTFRDYPDPIDSSTVTRWIHDRERLFRIVEFEGALVSCASADLDQTNRSAELTDCATVPELRGRGLTTAILHRLERDCQEDLGISDFYTLARAGEAGINIAFARLGYEYTGRLVNNCRMPEGWESMNAWCRRA